MAAWRARWGGCFWRSAFLPCSPRLALAFDPRYRDFPFAPLTCAAVPFLLVAFLVPRPAGVRPVAETVAAVVLVLAAAAIVDQRRLRQLAGGLVLRGVRRGGAQSGSGAGRARLRISSATANADSATL